MQKTTWKPILIFPFHLCTEQYLAPSRIPVKKFSNDFWKPNCKKELPIIISNRRVESFKCYFLLRTRRGGGGGSWMIIRNQIIFLHLIPVTFLLLYCYYLWKLQNKLSLYSRRVSVPFRGIASIWEELFLNCDVLQGSQLRGSKINLHFTPIIYVWRVMNRFNTYLKIQETISVWIKYSEDMSTESFSVSRWEDLTEQLE